MGANLIIIDEMAYIPSDLFFKVIVPILQMADTALFGLSSPEGSQNFFSKLINLKAGDQPFFRVCDCQLICEDCRKLKPDEQVLCNHVKQQAKWLSSKKGERMKLLYGADSTTIAKEMMGVIADDFVPCFPQDLIQDMFALPSVVTTSSPKYVFVTIDPSGGGVSQLGICSGYYNDELEYVVSGPIMYSRRAARSNSSTISIMLCRL